MPIPAYRRRGMTLLELLAVVTLMGIFAAVAMARFGRSVFADFGAEADARKIGLAMLQAKRRAITTGSNHGVTLRPTSGAATSFTVDNIESGATVDGPYPLAATVTSTASPMTFAFDGSAQAPYVVTLQGPNRKWQISVVPINGTIQTTDITPH